MEYVVSLLKIFFPDECYTRVFVDGELELTCLKLALSKALGYAIFAGSMGLRSPQIYSIVTAKKDPVAGISAMFMYLDLVVFTIMLAFGFRQDWQLSTYGEAYFMTAQDLLIVFLLHWHTRTMTSFAGGFAIYALCAYAMLAGIVPFEYIQLLQAATVPIGIASRLPQIYKIYSEQSAGQLSLFMFLLNTCGALARVFTTLAELSDIVMLSGFAISATLNGIITAQIFYHNFVANSKSKKVD
jgi:mannose-P-dolichol utilization defect 1